jgi:hypothetical protein
MLVIVPGQAKSKGESWASPFAKTMTILSEFTMGYYLKKAMSIAPLRPSLASSLVQSLVLLSRLLLNSAE